MIINILSLNSFSVYAEYFIVVSIIYVLILFILVVNNIQGLFFQNVISEAFAIILLSSCLLILNENQFFFNVLNQQLKNKLFYSLNTHSLYDNVSAISKFILCFCSFIFFIIISEFFKKSLLTFEFIILLFFAVLGLIFICSSGDFILIFLSIELVSLVSYLITGFRKKSIRSIESSIKYLVIGAISSSLFVLGISFIYLFTGSFLISDYTILFLDLTYSFFTKKLLVADILINYKFLPAFENIVNAFGSNKNIFSNSFLIEIGLFLILISVFLKLSLAPFHLWSLDIYENAPIIATFFLVPLLSLVLLFFYLEFLFHLYNIIII